MKKIISSLLATSLLAVACTGTNTNTSSTKSTHIPVSSSKRQALGNCWLYAAMSWLESNLMIETSHEYNLSESYMLYRIYESRLMKSIYENQPFPEQIYSGGEWYEIVDLINEYGVMFEKDFIPSEANNPLSEAQAYAESYMNESLAHGLLSENHSAEAVKLELNRAFNVNPEEFAQHIISADQIEIGGRSLRDMLSHWQERKIEFYNPENGARPQRAVLTPEGQRLMIAAKDHLNQHRPLLANWWIDFSGVDESGTLSANFGEGGDGGAHMSNLVDYTASGVDPETGRQFETGEGEVSDHLKYLAMRYGNIDAFILRNTWGENRTDRPDYHTRNSRQKHRGGFQRLNSDYIFSWLPISPENSEKNFGLQDMTGVYAIVMPDYGLSDAAVEAMNQIQ